MKVKRIVFACAVALAVSAFSASAQQGKPQYGEWGYDIAGADKDSLAYPFLSPRLGSWIDKTEILATLLRLFAASGDDRPNSACTR